MNGALRGTARKRGPKATPPDGAISIRANRPRGRDAKPWDSAYAPQARCLRHAEFARPPNDCNLQRRTVATMPRLKPYSDQHWSGFFWGRAASGAHPSVAGPEAISIMANRS